MYDPRTFLLTLLLLAIAPVGPTVASPEPSATNESAGSESTAASWREVADFDADGFDDRLFARRGDAVLTFRRGDGDGGFHSSRRIRLAAPIRDIAVADLNRRDGLPDAAVLLGGEEGRAELWIFESPAGALEAAPERIALPASSRRIQVFRSRPGITELSVRHDNGWTWVHGRDRRLSWRDPLASAEPLRIEEVMSLDGLAMPGPAPRPSAKGGTIFTVGSSADAPDTIPGDGLCETSTATCTLRAAIEEANALPGLDTVEFTAGVTVALVPSTPLLITDPLVIDGTSHPAFGGMPVVEIDGSLAATPLVLAPGSSGSVILALVVHSASGAGITISSSDLNLIAGCHLGTDPSGTVALGNEDGIHIVGVSTGNLIGGTESGAGNVISGNLANGINLDSDDVAGNRIEGNLIGTDVTGLADLGNGAAGIRLRGPDNVVGGLAPGARNVISWNDVHGIAVRDGGNLLQGNWIGLVLDGTAAGNGMDGVHFGDSPGGTLGTVGGTVAGARNVISSNGRDGIRIAAGADTLIQGNFIGTDPTGLLARGNGGYGICDGCLGGFRNTVGGIVEGAGNVISANALGGYDTGTFDSVVQGNLVGLGFDGETLLGNFGVGVANADMVGGSDPLAGNWVSANTGDGLLLGGFDVALGNRIGVTASGDPAGNGGVGIRLLASLAIIGGTGTGMGNVVAHNADAGVIVLDFGVANTISRNSIYDNGGLGLDIDDDGVTANDAGDSDAGTNNLQNFPVLTSADAATNAISGSLDGEDGVIHVVEFFSNEACDGSGQGEGKTYLGSGVVETFGGPEPFSIPVTFAFSAGQSITATATNAGASTSEFSACVTATGVATPIFSDGFESGDTTSWSSTVD